MSPARGLLLNGCTASAWSGFSGRRHPPVFLVWNLRPRHARTCSLGTCPSRRQLRQQLPKTKPSTLVCVSKLGRVGCMPRVPLCDQRHPHQSQGRRGCCVRCRLGCTTKLAMERKPRTQVKWAFHCHGLEAGPLKGRPQGQLALPLRQLQSTASDVRPFCLPCFISINCCACVFSFKIHQPYCQTTDWCFRNEHNAMHRCRQSSF